MGDLSDLERQQRKAYWKGEQEAASRLVPFDPRNPLAGAALEEAERIEAEVERVQEAARRYRHEQMVKHLMDQGAKFDDAQMLLAVYGDELLDQPQDVLDSLISPKAWRGGYVPHPEGGWKSAGFSGTPTDAGGNPIPFAPPTTYTTPATNIAEGPGIAHNIPDELADDSPPE